MQILHLEDSTADAELIRELLRAQWPDCDVTVINSRDGFETAVKNGGFDLILSDFSLPGYNGLTALGFAQEHCPEKPFIYLSGTIGEERAVAALKAGAMDYVVKDRPARLIPAISAAMSRTEHLEARRRAEEKIREQASLLDKAREAICAVDAAGRVTYWNASAERIYGWSAEEATGRSLREMLYAENPTRFENAYAQARAAGEWRGELRPLPRRGETILVESSWTLVIDKAGGAKSILIVDADITEKRKIEIQSQQSQRLETLGLLVGGIAHDLNNMLAPIITSVSILREKADRPDDSELLEILDLSAHHGADLVRQLLAFARGGSEERSETDVDALIGSARKLLQRAMPENIELRAAVDHELWRVPADATQLRQILLNLCLNARDAMPNGGSIEISARGVEVEAGATGVQGEAKAGPYVRISVADSGIGIPPEIAKKIFDPFFTTKQVGKGTGLGLANVAGIIKSHGGFLDLESTPGVGTTFHVFLPAAVHETARQTPAGAGRGSRQGQGERILIVEPDSDMRTVMEVILNTRGYRVTMVESGEEGWEKLQTPGDFDLVMTDVNMPGMSGAELIRRIQAQPVAPKVVAICGSPPGAEEDPAGLEGVEFLRKPLTVDGMLKVVRRALEAAV